MFRTGPSAVLFTIYPLAYWIHVEADAVGVFFSVFCGCSCIYMHRLYNLFTSWSTLRSPIFTHYHVDIHFLVCHSYLYDINERGAVLKGAWSSLQRHDCKWLKLSVLLLPVSNSIVELMAKSPPGPQYADDNVVYVWLYLSISTDALMLLSLVNWRAVDTVR